MILLLSLAMVLFLPADSLACVPARELTAAFPWTLLEVTLRRLAGWEEGDLDALSPG